MKNIVLLHEDEINSRDTNIAKGVLVYKGSLLAGMVIREGNSIKICFMDGEFSSSYSALTDLIANNDGLNFKTLE